MWHAAGRSALAASRSPRAPTTSPPSARPGRRTYSRPWPTPPPCSTPSSREPALGLAGGRARSQGTDRRSRWAARRAGARGRDARLSGRHDRPTVRSGPYADEARSGAAAARVSTGRRQSGLWRVGVEGATLATREVPPPRRSGSARCGPRLRGDHPRAAGVCGVGAHRPSRGGVSARPGPASPRVGSGGGCAARGRRRAGRDRAPARGERAPAARGGEIARPARGVRMPRRLRRRRLLAGPEKRAIAARLAAGGEPLVAALDALDAVATRVREASVLDKAAHAEWQEALRTAARRLEAAWLALETQVADEHRRWADEIDAVARWRPSLWPLVALWTPLGVALVWLNIRTGSNHPTTALDRWSHRIAMKETT